MKQKRQKQPKRVSEPDAFKRAHKFPEIIPCDDARTENANIRPEIGYAMGQIYIAYAPEFVSFPALLVVNHPNRLPTWDEIVWIRYQVCPEVESFGLILPALEEYINYDSGRAKYTMTLEDISMRRAIHERLMSNG